MPVSLPPPDPATRRAARSTLLAQNWWLVALRGLFAILFGVLTFAWPGVTIATLVIFFAAYLLVDGVAAIAAAIRAAERHERWGLLVLEGLADIAAGVVALLWPAITALVFVYLIAGWSIVSGLLMTVAAFGLELTHGRWWLVLGGVFSMIFGVLLAVAPIAGAVVLTFWLAAYAIVFGVVMLVLAFRLRSRGTSAA